MKRRALSLLLTLTMLLSLVPAFGVSAAAATPSGNVLPTDGGTLSGTYYLSTDTTLSANITVASGTTLTIDLNNYVLKGTGNGSVITNKGTLTIKDSGSTVWRYFTDEDSDGCYETYEGNTYSSPKSIGVQGGCITGGSSVCGGGVYNEGTFTLESGNIVGCKAVASGSGSGGGSGSGSGTGTGTGESTFRGGAVYNTGNFTMKSGNIVGCKSSDEGGALYNCATTILQGGIIKECSAMSGGAIYNKKGTDSDKLSVESGSKINYCAADGTAETTGFGGAIYNDNGAKAELAGTIYECSATQFGGGIFNRGTLTMSSGEIYNCSAVKGAGVHNHGDAAVSFTMNGGKIESNKAKQSGGGLQNSAGATFTMTGGKIQNNHSGYNNSSVYYGAGVFSAGTVNLDKKAYIFENTNNNHDDYCNLSVVEGSTVTVKDLDSNLDNALIGVSLIKKIAGVYQQVSGNVATFNVYSGGGTDTRYKNIFSDDGKYLPSLTGSTLSVSEVASHTNHNSIYWNKLSDALGNDYSIGANNQTMFYYVDEDITAGYNIKINGAVVLCLNGNVLDLNENRIQLLSGCKGMNLYDCGSAVHKFTEDGNGLWTLSNSGTKSVIGGVITNGNGTDGGAVTIGEQNTFNMYGGNLVGNSAKYGGAVYNGMSLDSFHMFGGTIQGNVAEKQGGGVYNFAGTVEIAGGKIMNNTATMGGGIYQTATENVAALSRTFATGENTLKSQLVHAAISWGGSSKLLMTGGEICNNHATDASKNAYGGGVFSDANCQIFMSGGKITGNTAKTNGDGVWAVGGNIRLTSLNRTYTAGKNTIVATSVHARSGPQFDPSAIILGGTAQITGNDGENLYLEKNMKVTVGNGSNGAVVPTTMKVGVTTEISPTAGTPTDITVNGVSTDLQYFSSDNSAYEVKYNTNHLVLAVKAQSTGGDPTSTITVPVSGDKDSVKVQATVNGTNATIKNVTSDEITEVGTGDNVVIDLSGLNKSVTGVTIPKTTMENVAASEAKGLEVKLPNGTVAVFDKTTLAAVASQAKGANIQLVVDRDSKAEQSMTKAQKETVSEMNKPVVLDAYFTSNGQRISDFKGGEADITATYPTTSPVRVWYVTDAGEKELVPSTYDGKVASFTVKHFSHYVIEMLDGSSYDTCPQDSTCVYAKFSDANPKEWYHSGAHFCVENGYMNGITTTQFAPSGTLSRGMIVTMLWRIEGSPVANYAMSFKDVADDFWYTEAIRWAQSTGVVTGYDDVSFGPENNVTREQLAAILWRYAKYKGYDVSVGEDTNILSYDDAIGGISEYAISAMQWACGAGIINGIGNKLEAHGFATRAQAACMIQRFCVNIAK